MTTIAFIVNGDYNSAMGYRARDLASRLPDSDVSIAYRSNQKTAGILKFLIFLVQMRPVVTYVFDISYSGILGAGCYRVLFRNSLIVETGDAISELVRSTGSRGRIGIWLTTLLENAAMFMADRIVVRGSFHKDWLSRQGIEADVIQDGVDTYSFLPEDGSELRKQLGLQGTMTIGLIGSSVWSDRLQMCYGWELVETLRLLKGKPVKGVMIGSGTGIAHLKALCEEYGIEGNIVFLGHVPYEQLARYMNIIDICLSTQSNNLVGQVRTTGKLPLYLAAGRYILASDVGEAAIVLENDMLVPYHGVKDSEYPQKLSERIERILEHPEMLQLSIGNISLARKHFDYNHLAKRMNHVIAATLKRRESQA